MATLKVGDKVVLETAQQWGNNRYFRFEEVVRVTRTQAILSNGVRLKIESRSNWKNIDEFTTIGENYEYWQYSTPKIIAEAEAEKKRQEVNAWFSKQKFTDEQKAAIYKMFKEVEVTN